MMPVEDELTSSSQGRPGGCLARLFWMLIGNLCLLLCAKVISDGAAYALGPADLVFWAIIVLLMAVRYLDIRRFGGLTAWGQPASLGHWRRYAALLLIFALLLWFSARGVAAWKG